MGKRYSDNSKFIYEYLLENHNEFDVYWFTRNKSIYEKLRKDGKPVVYKNNIKSIWVNLTAKFSMFDQSIRDLNYIFAVNTIKINLWHGIPLKKFGVYLKDESSSNRDIRVLEDDYLLATSEYTSTLLSGAFGYDRDKMIISMYPRNSVFFKNNTNIIGELFSIFYLPTFREKPLHDNPFIKHIDFIDNELNNQGIILYVKLHYKERHLIEKKSLKNIVVLEAEFDIYEIISNIDLLITDYSSIYLDYILSKKALLFYPYDYKHYKNVERGFLFDYYQNTPGDKVYDLEELIASIISIKSNYDKYLIKYHDSTIKLIDKMYKHNKENYEEIINVLNKGK